MSGSSWILPSMGQGHPEGWGLPSAPFIKAGYFAGEGRTGFGGLSGGPWPAVLGSRVHLCTGVDLTASWGPGQQLCQGTPGLSMALSSPRAAVGFRCYLGAWKT